MIKLNQLRNWPQGVPYNLKYGNQPITAVISKYARAQPRRVAINFYGRKITYAELESFSDCFAGSLAQLGIRKGDRVAVYMENSPQFIIALLGCWKSGAVVVPSNPMFLGSELASQLIDTGAETIILQDNLFPVFDEIKKRTPVTNVIIADSRQFLPNRPLLPLHHSLKNADAQCLRHTAYDFGKLINKRVYLIETPELDDLALIQYTAGTTGLPKGAMITHRNLLFNTAGSAAWFNGRPSDVHLAVLPLFEVTGLVHSMCKPLYTGSTIILLARYDTETVLKAIARFKCTHWANIATMNIAVINYPNVSGWDLGSLRYCVSGGSPVPPEVATLFQELTGVKLAEGYGLSETISQVTLNPPDKPRLGSVGIPVHDTRVKVVDINDMDKELPPGQEGELLVKGPQVMQGYWNRPGETRLALRDGWLATGDMARVDQDGYVYIVGRKRELIKPSGFLIFPAEVEGFLREHPAVAEVVVVGAPDPYRIETVKAYIVLRQEYEGKISETEIINWSRNKMAAYKYPRIVEFVNELPHKGDGKVNRFYLTG